MSLRSEPRATPWREKRRQRLEIDGHKCRTCGHDGSVWQLEIHHISYDRWGDEDVEKDLITLCEPCHKAITSSIRRRVYADRYIGLEFEDLVPTVTTRVEVNYGMATTEIRTAITVSDAYAQWKDGESAGSVREDAEGDLLQKEQNRRRLRADGAD